MVSEVNSKEYWDHRFATGHWERSNGRSQTSAFAGEQVSRLRLPAGFSGAILDFGCGLGDAIPVYRKRFPDCRLIGVDHSEAAIAQCRIKYGHLATFVAGGLDALPDADVIIASNVMEHIADDEGAVRALLSRCSELYVFVPFDENPLHFEHVNRYDRNSFSTFERFEVEVFASSGWSQFGRALWVDVYLKNLLRPFFGRSRVQRRRQIMYRLRGDRGPIQPCSTT